MKVVILAGGFGTRISEESHLVPKPMIRIGEYPILWHIMKLYSHYGFYEFIILAGYKQHVIKDFFNHYPLYLSDVTFDYTTQNMTISSAVSPEPWKVTIIDTGLHTMTGGRLKKIKEFVDDTFLMTYGDGVSNINIKELVAFHEKHKRLATLSAVRPTGRFGLLDIDVNHKVTSFKEKHLEDSGWINGGFMVLNKQVLDLIEGDQTVFEYEPLEKLAQMNQLMAYPHHGFWQCMDTLRDKELLEKIWYSSCVPWKVWS